MKTRSAARSTIAIALHWGDNRVAMLCLGEGERFSYGEGKDLWSSLPVVDEIPWGFALARVDRGEALASVPEGAIVLVNRADGQFTIVHGPKGISLSPGDRVTFKAGAITLVISADAPIELPKGRSSRRGVLLPILSAALVHGLVMGLAAQASAARKLEEPGDDQLDAARELLIAAEQRVRDNPPPTGGDALGKGKSKKVTGKDGDGRAAGGARAKGEAGAMGDESASRDKRGRYAVQEHHKGDKERSISHNDSLREAQSFGMIGLLLQDNPGSAVAAVWGKAEAHGADAFAVKGAMWGDRIDTHYGPNGLQLTGIGEGGGGVGEGIGLGTIGTIGHGAGKPGDGTDGAGTRPLPGRGSFWGHKWKTVYRCAYCGSSVSGRLPPESVQRIIRQNSGRFRACYEKGLLRNPSLAGRVATKFVIGRDGAVASASLESSSMPDEQVNSCVVRAFYGLSFPQPEGGIVTVMYPFVFSPPET